MWNLGPWELLIIFGIVFLIFGAKRLPEVGKSLGTGIREFKKSVTAINEEIQKDDDEPEKTEEKQKPEIRD